jgi:hypothetical protein
MLRRSTKRHLTPAFPSRKVIFSIMLLIADKPLLRSPEIGDGRPRLSIPEVHKRTSSSERLGKDDIQNENRHSILYTRCDRHSGSDGQRAPPRPCERQVV